MKIIASGPITLWQIDGKNVEMVSDLIFLVSKINAGGDCSHEIKKNKQTNNNNNNNTKTKKNLLLLGRMAMTNLESILKSRDITLPTKVHIVKAMILPVGIYGCGN